MLIYRKNKLAGLLVIAFNKYADGLGSIPAFLKLFWNIEKFSRDAREFFSRFLQKIAIPVAS